jgi:hypothetical protein
MRAAAAAWLCPPLRDSARPHHREPITDADVKHSSDLSSCTSRHHDVGQQNVNGIGAL